jgi:citrate lyase subunit alpha/citrate CoA-transferase
MSAQDENWVRELEPYGHFRAYMPGENTLIKSKDQLPLRERQRIESKIVDNLETAVRSSGLRNGMTISFHHHFREGDAVVNFVLDILARMGFKNLCLAASSLSDVHAPLIGHIQNGLISSIETSGLRGELACAISHGLMAQPVIFRSHGGRASAIVSGKLHIDVAFLSAPSVDPFGNANGYSREGAGKSACGSMGYAKVDAQYADKVIILSDNIVNYPNTPFGIPQSQVDYIVEVETIGDQAKIATGATRSSQNPHDLLIAQTAADVIVNSGYFEEGFSLQTGTGGASLAVTRFIRERMLEKGIKASFALGGITGSIVKLHEEGLIRKLLDVQSFDLEAIESLKTNRFHQQIDANYYANPYMAEGAAVNQLDIVVLSALEADLNFNINVLTGSDGVIRGAIGGHPDCAAGAALSILVAPLIRGRMPTILDRVNTICTPGRTVDVLVTDQGIAVNPNRPEIEARLKAAHMKVTPIEALQTRAEKVVGKPEPLPFLEKAVGIVTYRDGSVIDVIRQIGERKEQQADG